MPDKEAPPEIPQSRRVDDVEAQLRAILDSALDALITIDEQGRIVEFNRSAERIFGYSRDQVVGKEMAEIIVPPGLRDQHRKGMQHYLRTGEGPILGRRIEITGMRSDGSEFPVELTVTRVPSETRMLFTGALRDLTERQRLEARRSALYAVTAILAATQSLEEAIPELLTAICRGLGWEFGQCWMVDEEVPVLRWIGASSGPPGKFSVFERASRGMTFAKGIGLPGRVWLGGEPAWLESIASDSNFPRRQFAAEAGIETGFGSPIRTATRTAGVLEFFTAERRPDDDDLLRFVEALGRQLGDFVDKTEAEQAVRESEERYRRILETTNEGIWWIDADARTFYVNERMAAMLGERAADIKGRSLFDYLYDPDKEQVRAGLARRQRGANEPFDMRLRRRDGSAIWALVSSTPVANARGEYAGALAMITDISTRKRGEEADRFLVDVARELASSLDYESTLKRVTALAVPRIADWCEIRMLGEDGRLSLLGVSHVDPRQAELARQMNETYSPDPESPVGPSRVARTGLPELIPEISDSVLALATRSPEHLETVRALGLRSSICVPLSSRGRTLGTLTLVSAESGYRYDASDRVLAEQVAGLAAMAIDNARLYQDAQSAISLRDDFLAIAGHELRTPLSTLSLEVERLSLAGRAASSDDPQWHQRIRRSVERLRRLIEDLLDVSRASAGRLTLEPEPVELVRLCRGVAERFADELARKGSRLDLRAPESIQGVWDPRRLEQVVENLLSNAVKYGGGATIELDLREEGDEAVIEVRDRGIGIAREDHDRIFRRFERAVPKTHFGGLGLGLWIASEIVRAFGGAISVESSPGSGASFTVRIPKSPAAQESLGRLPSQS